MSTMLRGAAALFLGMIVTAAASAAPTMDASLAASPWDESLATSSADEVELLNPVQLATSCEASCAADDSAATTASAVPTASTAAATAVPCGTRPRA